jgi:hypothetical protein
VAYYAHEDVNNAAGKASVSALTVSNAAAQASVSTAAKEEAGSNVAARAPASTTADEHRQLHQDCLPLSSLSHNSGVAKGTMFIINHEGLFKPVKHINRKCKNRRSSPRTLLEIVLGLLLTIPKISCYSLATPHLYYSLAVVFLFV